MAQALAGNELGRRSKARRDKAHRGPCQCRSTVAAANKAGSGTSRQTMQVNAFNTQLRSLSVCKAGGRRIIANALCKIATPSQPTLTIRAQIRQSHVACEPSKGV